MGQYTILFIPLALAVVALHAAWIARRRLMARRHWLLTDAKVVSVLSGRGLLREIAPLSATSILTLQYRAHASPFSSRQFLSSRLDLETGSLIQVRYNPDKPEEVMVEESTAMVIAALFREAVFALLLAVILAASLDALFRMGSTRQP